MEKRDRTNDVIILFGGGVESIWMLKYAKEVEKKEPVLMYVKYFGNLAQYTELRTLWYWAAKEDVEVEICEVNGLEQEGRVWLLRNYIFVMLAAAKAKVIGAKEVWLGGEYMEKTDEFVDQFPEPYKYVEELAKTFDIDVKVRLPLFEKKVDKKKAVEDLIKWGVDIEKEIVSCDYGKGYWECNCAKCERLGAILKEVRGW